jgi:hypothetical protein
MMDMQYGVLAKQRHHERIQRALAPRPEPYGPLAPPATPHPFAAWSRIADVVQLPWLLIPRVVSRRP